MVNLLAEVCATAGGNVLDLIEVLKTDPRIGDQYMSPGIGYGGSCLPKDLRGYLAQAGALDVGASVGLLAHVDAVNMRQRSQAVNAALRALQATGTNRVAVLGATFKPGSDDIRDSPALDIANTLQRQGVDVAVHDPAAGAVVRERYRELDVVDDAVELCRSVAVVLVLTDWPDYAQLDPVDLRGASQEPHVIDGRLMLDSEKWCAAGWQVHQAGWSAAA